MTGLNRQHMLARQHSAQKRGDTRRVDKPRARSPDTLRTRENTRARLVNAGRKLFFSREYNAISVELITREAGLTRAAFYLHFSTKDDLLAAMMVEESTRTDPLFRWFDTLAPGPESIAGFIAAFVISNRESPGIRLFHLAALHSPEARMAFERNRTRLMAVLGESFPAFRPAASSSPDERRRIARARLFIIALEQFALDRGEGHGAEGADPDLERATEQELVEHMLWLHHAYP